MLSVGREEADESEEEPPFFQQPETVREFIDARGLDYTHALRLKEIADAGGMRGWVDAKAVAGSDLRKLRIMGFIELLDAPGHIQSKLTVRGLQILPHALKLIAAGPSIGAGA